MNEDEWLEEFYYWVGIVAIVVLLLTLNGKFEQALKGCDLSVQEESQQWN